MRIKSKNKRSFTLIELLIAMSLSSFIVMGLMQSYHALMRYIDRSRGMMVTNRRACLLFNQIERDFTTAFIPEIHKKIKSKNPKKPGEKEAPEDKEDKEEQVDPNKQLSSKEQADVDAKKLEVRKKFFLGVIKEGDTVRINKKRYELFKNVTFITTDALQVYGQKKVRIVRVMYELVVDKPKSKGDNICYKLFRRETSDLKNVKMKVDEFELDKQKISSISSHVVAEGLKSMHIEYVTLKQPDKKDGKQVSKENKEPEELRFFTWGDRPETKGVVPQRIELTVVFWSDDLSATQSFQVIIPVLSYPTELEKKGKKDKQGQVSASGGAPVASEASPDLVISGEVKVPGVSNVHGSGGVR
ncbi:MAG: prepilin-type N-terminal cleavage/methylation domain-containing protein [bacterium]